MEILEYIKENSNWIVPIIVTIISGVFGLFKISGRKNSQTIKNVKDSNVQQANGSINITINKTENNK